MSMEKFTPGPWIHRRPTGYVGTAGETSQTIASVYGDSDDCSEDDRQIANALLIAAAPQMFEALRELVKWHGKRGGDADELLPADQQESEIAEAMRALAAATGEAQ